MKVFKIIIDFLRKLFTKKIKAQPMGPIPIDITKKKQVVDFGMAFVVSDNGRELYLKRNSLSRLRIPKRWRIDFDGVKDGNYKVVKDNGLKIKLKRRKQRPPYPIGMRVELPKVEVQERKKPTQAEEYAKTVDEMEMAKPPETKKNIIEMEIEP